MVKELENSAIVSYLAAGSVCSQRSSLKNLVKQRMYVGEVTTALGEVMLKGPCLAICGRATKISSEAVWRNIYYLTEESPYIWLVSILVICSLPRLVRLGYSTLILRYFESMEFVKSHFGKM